MRRTVPKVCDFEAVIKFVQTFIELFVFEEDKSIREENNPAIGMISGEPREDFSCLKVVLHGCFTIVKVEHEFKEIGVGNSIGYIVLTHFCLSNSNGIENLFLKALSLSIA